MKQFDKRKKGFTLMELMITVAIVAILVAITIPFVENYVRKLRQKELDSKAEVIYTAVQNELSRLKMTGQSNRYQPVVGGDAREVPSVPADDDGYYGSESDPGHWEDEDHPLYFVTSSGIDADSDGIAANLMNEKVVDAELLDNQWVIEYDPQAALVYAVFYSEGNPFINELYVSDFDDGENINEKGRDLDNNGRGDYWGVGYYGGGGDLSSAITHNLKLTVTVENSEELILHVRCVRPSAVDEETEPVMKVTLSDSFDHSFSQVYSTSLDAQYLWLDSDENSSGSTDGGHLFKNVNIVHDDPKNRAYEFDVVLDSLKDSSMRFSKLYGPDSKKDDEYLKAMGEFKSDDMLLTPGSDIHIEVEAYCPHNILVERKTLKKDTNSLFAYEDKEENGESGSTEPSVDPGESETLTALIENGRHLQNLDASSGVSEKVTEAVVTSDIHLESSPYLDTGFAVTYGEVYFNGTDKNGRPLFKPIGNTNLVSLTGRVESKKEGSETEAEVRAASISGLYVDATADKDTANNDGGLFGKVDFSKYSDKKLTIGNLHLTGETVLGGSNAGGLVASISGSGTLTINGVQTYLLKTTDVMEKKAKLDDTIYTVQADHAGGLVGSVSGANLDIKFSSASLLVGNKETTVSAGGWVGLLSSGKLTASSSYADGYSFAYKSGAVAGLVVSDSGTVELTNCYGAGFVYTENPLGAAGLVRGKLNAAHNVYTVVTAQTGSAGLVSSVATSAGELSKISKVFYKGGGLGDYFADKLNPYDVKFFSSAQELLSSLGDAFTLSYAISDLAYNFYIDGLSNYIYPVLKNGDGSSVLFNYGDWGAAFERSALVYYEKYRRVDDEGNTLGIVFGFDGANEVSSLKNDSHYILLGDGYGLVFEKEFMDSVKSRNTKGSVYVTAHKLERNSADDGWNTEWTTVNLNTNTNMGFEIQFDQYSEYKDESSGNEKVYYPVDGGSAKYVVFPIPALTKTFEKGSYLEGYSFYCRVDVQSKLTGSMKTEGTKSFFYQPDYAKTVLMRVGDIEETTLPEVGAESSFSVRSPRQFYDMSKHYDIYQKTLTPESGNVTFTQEREIDYLTYDWSHFSGFAAPFYQEPIGTGPNAAFTGIFNGNCYRIRNISFSATSYSNFRYIGMFGYNKGNLYNIVLDAEYHEADPFYVRDGSSKHEANDTIYMGILAGYNAGEVYNCTCAGYIMEGENNTIVATSNSNLYLGCLVGYNGEDKVDTVAKSSGSIRNSSVASPIMTVENNGGMVRMGGFVGYNASSSSIANCYDIASLNVPQSSGGYVAVGGFAGYNIGRISNSYSATYISTSSTVRGYGFAPTGGSVSDCSFLNGGTFTYVGIMHNYDLPTKDNNGTPVNYRELTALRGSNHADVAHTRSHSRTQTGQSEDYPDYDGYPYPAFVRDAAGAPVHYGDWQDVISMGAMGMFYWEHEEGSNANNGYHFSYVGIDATASNTTGEVSAKISEGSNLCIGHDDGNVITEYGYGFYFMDDGSEYKLKWDNDVFDCSLNSLTGDIPLNSYNVAASLAFEKQMANSGKSNDDFAFYAVTTSGREQLKRNADGTMSIDIVYRGQGLIERIITAIFDRERTVTDLIVNTEDTGVTDYLYIKNNALQGDVTLSYMGRDFTFTVNPFFADSFTYRTDNATEIEKYGTKSKVNATLGTESTPYGIRSYDQLKYINWNSVLHVPDFNFREADIQTKSEEQDEDKTAFGDQNHGGRGQTNYKRYPYLDKAGLCWVQSHDLEADDASLPFASRKSFMPIGQFGEPFLGVYNGGGYRIKNLYIKSPAQTVGLFGRVGNNQASGSVSNVILMADSGRGRIECNYESEYAATVGAVIGLAKNCGTIYNCATSGYQIVYAGDKNKGSDRENNKAFDNYGWRYNSPIIVGGLVGAAYNSSIRNCSAVNDLSVSGDTSYVRTEIGGIAGTIGSTNGLPASIVNCYSGGTISDCGSQRALFAGIVANARGVDVDTAEDWIMSIFNQRNVNWPWYVYGPFADRISISNCYTYCDIPESHGTVRFSNFSDWEEITGALRTAFAWTVNLFDIFDIIPDTDREFYRNGRTTLTSLLQTDLAGKRFYIAGNAGDRDYRVLPILFFDVVLKDETTTINIDNCYFFQRSKDLEDTYHENGLFDNSFGITGLTVPRMTITNDNVDDPEFLLAKLGSPWSRVATTIGGIVDAGAYTYPTNSGLRGLDFPFPAVVKEAGKYVHYGDWVSEDPYWEYSREVFDVFSDESYNPEHPDVPVEKTYYLIDNRGQLDKVFYKGLSAADFTFEPSDSRSIEITNVKPGNPAEHDGLAGYEVTIRALKAGTDSDPAITVIYPKGFVFSRLSVEVTADIQVTLADPEEEPMVYAPSLDLTLYAEDSGNVVEDTFALRASDNNGIDEEGNGKDFTPYVKWAVSSQDTKEGVNPFADVTPPKKDEGNNIAFVEGKGKTTAYVVEAKLNYNRAEYKGTAQLQVTTDSPSTVGVSDNVNEPEGGAESQFVRMRLSHNGDTPVDELTGTDGLPEKFAVAPAYKSEENAPELFLFYRKGDIEPEEFMITNAEITKGTYTKDEKATFRVYTDETNFIEPKEGVIPLALHMERNKPYYVDHDSGFTDFPLYFSVIGTDVAAEDLTDLELKITLKQTVEGDSSTCAYTLVAHPTVKNAVEACEVLIRSYDEALFDETNLTDDAHQSNDEKYRPRYEEIVGRAVKGMPFKLPECPTSFEGVSEYYSFAGWLVNGEKYKPGDYVLVDDAWLVDNTLIIDVDWAPNSYYVTLSLNDARNNRSTLHLTGPEGLVREREESAEGTEEISFVYLLPTVDNGLYSADHFRVEFDSVTADKWGEYEVCMWQSEDGRRFSASSPLRDVTDTDRRYQAVWQGKVYFNTEKDVDNRCNLDPYYFVIYGDDILDEGNKAFNLYRGSADPADPGYGTFFFDSAAVKTEHKRIVGWQAKRFTEAGIATEPILLFRMDAAGGEGVNANIAFAPKGEIVEAFNDYFTYTGEKTALLGEGREWIEPSGSFTLYMDYTRAYQLRLFTNGGTHSNAQYRYTATDEDGKEFYWDSFDQGTAYYPIPAAADMSRSDDVFGGWYLDEELTLPVDEGNMPVADFTKDDPVNVDFYAKWNYRLVFDANGGTFGENPGFTTGTDGKLEKVVEADEVVSVADFPIVAAYPEGKDTMEGWTIVDGLVDKKVSESLPNSSRTYFALYETFPAVDYQAEGGKVMLGDKEITDPIPYDPKVNYEGYKDEDILPVAEMYGYDFDGWFDIDGKQMHAADIGKILKGETKTWYAHYKAWPVVTLDIGNASIEDNSGEFVKNDGVYKWTGSWNTEFILMPPLENVKEAGKDCVGWCISTDPEEDSGEPLPLVDGRISFSDLSFDESGSCTLKSVTKDFCKLTLDATEDCIFVGEKNQFSVSRYADPFDLTPYKATYKEDHYDFIGWYDKEGTKYESIKLTEDETTLTAHYKKQWKLTLHPNGGDKLIGETAGLFEFDGNDYVYWCPLGEDGLYKVALPDATRPRARFTGWSPTPELDDEGKIPLTGDKELTATFINVWRITFDFGGGTYTGNFNGTDYPNVGVIELDLDEGSLIPRPQLYAADGATPGNPRRLHYKLVDEDGYTPNLYWYFADGENAGTYLTEKNTVVGDQRFVLKWVVNRVTFELSDQAHRTGTSVSGRTTINGNQPTVQTFEKVPEDVTVLEGYGRPSHSFLTLRGWYRIQDIQDAIAQKTLATLEPFVDANGNVIGVVEDDYAIKNNNNEVIQLCALWTANMFVQVDTFTPGQTYLIGRYDSGNGRLMYRNGTTARSTNPKAVFTLRDKCNGKDTAIETIVAPLTIFGSEDVSYEYLSKHIIGPDGTTISNLTRLYDPLSFGDDYRWTFEQNGANNVYVRSVVDNAYLYAKYQHKIIGSDVNEVGVQTSPDNNCNWRRLEEAGFSGLYNPNLTRYLAIEKDPVETQAALVVVKAEFYELKDIYFYTFD